MAAGHLRRGALAASLLLASSASIAEPITIGPFESILFNFKFDPAVVDPDPPFSTVVLYTTASSNGSTPAAGTMDLATELDGVGAGAVSANFLPPVFFIPVTFGFTDGEFSVRFFAARVPVTFLGPFAAGIGANGTATTAGYLPIVVEPSPVPVPGVALLLGAGLVGMAILRPRRAHGQPKHA